MRSVVLAALLMKPSCSGAHHKFYVNTILLQSFAQKDLIPVPKQTQILRLLQSSGKSRYTVWDSQIRRAHAPLNTQHLT